MSSSDPLGSLFFRYRKRKQISVDGHTPGLEYQTRHHGDTHAPPTGHAAQHNHGRDYLGGQDGTEYDPGRSFYSSVGPHYHGPPSWEGLPIEPTPPLRVAPGTLPPDEPEINHDLAGWLLRRFVNEATDAPASGSQSDQSDTGIQHLFDPNRTVRMTIGEIRAHMAAQREYLESVMAGEIIDKVAGGYGAGPSPEDIFNSALEEAAAQLEQAAAAMQALEPASPELDDSDLDPGAEMLETSEQIFGEQMDQAAEMFGEPHQPQSLDDLVEDEWKRMNQSAMPDPMQAMAPYDQFPPGMPMDPFGPGMGF